MAAIAVVLYLTNPGEQQAKSAIYIVKKYTPRTPAEVREWDRLGLNRTGGKAASDQPVVYRNNVFFSTVSDEAGGLLAVGFLHHVFDIRSSGEASK